VNADQTRVVVIEHLLAKAEQSLKAAMRDYDANDLGLATNRVYYACFYSASAVLLAENRSFVKHTGVRAALHQHLVQAGKLPKEFGRFYDRAFTERQEADYNAMATFTSEMVQDRIAGATRFVAEMKRLLER
jgi:uncharacterized protein (UPF0332 family)